MRYWSIINIINKTHRYCKRTILFGGLVGCLCSDLRRGHLILVENLDFNLNDTCSRWVGIICFLVYSVWKWLVRLYIEDRIIRSLCRWNGGFERIILIIGRIVLSFKAYCFYLCHTEKNIKLHYYEEFSYLISVASLFDYGSMCAVETGWWQDQNTVGK